MSLFLTARYFVSVEVHHVAPAKNDVQVARRQHYAKMYSTAIDSSV